MNSSKLKFYIVSIFSSLKRSFSSYSDIFYPEFNITFLNSFLVNIDAKLPSFSLSFKLNIDLIASMSYSSDSGSLYLLGQWRNTWLEGQENQQTKTFLSFQGQQQQPIKEFLFRQDFDTMNERVMEDPESINTYSNINIVIIILVEELKGLLELCNFLFCQCLHIFELEIFVYLIKVI